MTRTAHGQVTPEPATVLIAGSDTMTRTLLAAVISNHGFPVITAADGREAWTAFAECAPALVIPHWDASDFDALDLCRRIRGAVGDDCFVMVVTSREDRADLMQAVAARIDDYMWTPIDGERLGARLVMAQERLRLRRASRRVANPPNAPGAHYSDHAPPTASVTTRAS